MLEKKTRNCPATDEIVSYIYGELGGRASEAFETHLADCMVCTDEFAAVSNVRFSVYEWQKEEFAHLPTPQFSIPYEVTPVAETRVGVLSGLRELFAFGGWPVTAAAAIAVVIGVGTIGVLFLGGGEQQVATNVPRTEAPNAPTVSQLDTERTGSEIAPEIQKREVATAVEKRTTRPARPVNAHKASSVEPRKKTPSTKAPGLTAFDDDADTSLRLADLFDGIGS